MRNIYVLKVNIKDYLRIEKFILKSLHERLIIRIINRIYLFIYIINALNERILLSYF